MLHQPLYSKRYSFHRKVLGASLALYVVIYCLTHQYLPKKKLYPPIFPQSQDPWCNWITIDPLHGSVGENLFQYAALYAAARLNRKSPYIQRGKGWEIFKETFQFLSIPFKEMDPIATDSYEQSQEHRYRTFDTHQLYRLPCRRNVTLNGLFQSFKPFFAFFDNLHTEFSFAETINQECSAKLGYLLQKAVSHSNSTLIGVYVKSQSSSMGNKLADYLKRAMVFYRNRFKSVVFIVSGDNATWFQEIVTGAPKSIIFHTPSTAGMDLCLLSQSHHSIITTGSFSWWIGFLTGGNVVYMDESDPDILLKEEFYPSHWIGL